MTIARAFLLSEARPVGVGAEEAAVRPLRDQPAHLLAQLAPVLVRLPGDRADREDARDQRVPVDGDLPLDLRLAQLLERRPLERLPPLAREHLRQAGSAAAGERLVEQS